MSKSAECDPVNTGAKQADGRFRKGQSGNPAGKPRGARHRTTLMVEALMRGGAEQITSAVVSAAQKGDLPAAKIILDRIAPIRKDSPIEIDLPPLHTASDAVGVMQSVMTGLSRGEITPAEAISLSGLIETFIKSLEAHDFEERLSKLEAVTQK